MLYSKASLSPHFLTLLSHPPLFPFQQNIQASVTDSSAKVQRPVARTAEEAQHKILSAAAGGDGQQGDSNLKSAGGWEEAARLEIRRCVEEAAVKLRSLQEGERKVKRGAGPRGGCGWGGGQGLEEVGREGWGGR